MKIIKIETYENGAHANQTGNFANVPDGWAVIPDSITIPETFPFVGITVEGGVVTSMTAGVMPEPTPEPEPPISLNQRVTECEDALIELASLIGG